MRAATDLAPTSYPDLPARRGAPIAVAAVVSTAAVDENGRYSIEVPKGLSGTLRLAVISPREAAYGETVEVVAGKVIALSPIELEPSFDLRGQVVGRVAEIRRGLWVVAFDGHLSFTTRVLTDGTFTFRGLPPGRWGLHASHDDLIPGQAREEEGKGRDPWNGATIIDLGGKDSDTSSIKIGVVFDPCPYAEDDASSSLSEDCSNERLEGDDDGIEPSTESRLS